MLKLGNSKVEEGGKQDEGASHRPELPGRIFRWNLGYQEDEADEGEGLDGADEPLKYKFIYKYKRQCKCKYKYLEQGFGLGGEEGVCELAG